MRNGTYYGDDTITVDPESKRGAYSITEYDVLLDVSRVMESDVGEILDSTAVTIAAYWQHAGPTGYAFAQLATTGHVRLQDLADNLSAAFKDASASGDTDGYNELNCLATWALNHPSREKGKGK